ncbi:BglG family transcription antiterminator [Virgibacillus halodenitrificans]|uniref:BglG family transcription antiterminator n=1 Tax=Virgibacillus halodenitrificans TaxID=1482 RepID=UPI000EF45FB7|nr:BglG family transcription antiterminator [Virgibacillus halodenitrificans]MCG1027101.1 transcription antiterminator [Virgibacillus halodenitrificans]
MLNFRMEVILRELMAAKSPITGNYLATINEVTPRTTREDIKSLDSVLVNYGARVISVMGQGYQLNIMEEKQFQNLLKEVTEGSDGNNLLVNTPEERVSFLIKYLLLTSNYVKLDELAERLYVSKSTIQNDIKQVKKILLEYDLRLESRPNYGLKIVGDELKLRFCMAEYIFDREEKSKEHLLEPLFSSITQVDMDRIQNIIMKQITSNEITLSDIAINNLLIHISIAYKRIKSGHHVSLYHTDIQEIIEQKEYMVACEIVKDVEKEFSVKFPEEETAYIAIHLLGTKMLSHTKTDSKIVGRVLGDEISDLITTLLNKIEVELNLGINYDQELTIALALHLKPAINRFKYGMNIRNPMLEDIKKNYPLAFEAGIIAGLVIEESTGVKIDENEIGYLALHIGAAIERKKLHSGPKRCLIVCASGMGTAQLIYYKLKARFDKSLDVIGTTEYYNLDKVNLGEVDVIVSSIPIEEDLPVPVIRVNAILGTTDLERIEKFIGAEENMIATYFKKDLMYLRKDFADKETLLEFIHKELVEKKLVGEAFLESVYQREEVAPTSFGNLVAIPHPLTPQSKVTFLAICTLTKPIMWNEKPTQFICILSVKKGSKEDLQPMYEVLGNIVESNTMVQKLIQANSYEQFMSLLIQ